MDSVSTRPRPLRKAVLPVAGFGTRVLPATKAIPKEMLPVFDRPAIQYVVDEALSAGIEHIVFVTGRNKGAIEDYFDHAFELEAALKAKNKTVQLEEVAISVRPAGTMSFVRQQAALGLGHAVWCARDIVGDEPFAVMLPDMLMMAKPSCLAQMAAVYEKTGGNIIAVEPCEDPSGYGVIDPESREGRVIKMKGMVEKPKREDAPSNLFISGRYILQPDIFTLLEDQAPGAGNEIQLTDAMARLMQRQPFFALEYDGRTYDCGDKIGYLRANAAYALASQEHGAKAAETLAALLAER